MSRPDRGIWEYLRGRLTGCDPSVFSIAAFVQPLPHPEYLIAPSIDPLSKKNIEMDPSKSR